MERPSPLLRPVGVPLLILVLLIAALVAGYVRGFQMASERHERLQPQRAAAVLDFRQPTDAVNAVAVTADQRFLLCQVPAANGRRLVLDQELPERRLLRWLEPAPLGGSFVVIPLEGLANGRYSLSWAAPDEQATPVEQDAAPTPRDVLGRFEIQR